MDYLQALGGLPGISRDGFQEGQNRQIDLQDHARKVQQEQAKFAAERQAAELKQAKEADYYERVLDIRDNGANPQKLNDLALAHPEYHETITGQIKGLSEESRRSLLIDAGGVYAAFDRGNNDAAQGIIKRHLDATTDPEERKQWQTIMETAKTDPATAKSLSAMILHSADPDKFASSYAEFEKLKTSGQYSLGPQDKRYDASGAVIAENTNLAPHYVEGPNGEQNLVTGNTAPVGDLPASSYDVVFGHGQYAKPSAPLTTLSLGEVSKFQKDKLIPATRGKVGAGPDQGTGAAGAYQITYGTLKQYAPKLFGENWRSVTYTPENQERLAEAIYNDARNGDLQKTWASLPSNKPGEYSNVPWEQVRNKIARGESGGGIKVTRLTGAKPTKIDAPSGYEPDGTGGLRPIRGGPADKQNGGALPKVPASTVKAYVENGRSIRQIGETRKALSAYRDGVGAWNKVTPDFVAQRIDPKGVSVRAMIADIGSMLIHDRSGAAVTVSETPRLLPFIPQVSDTPEAIIQKLNNLEAALVGMQQDMEDAYSNEAGNSALSQIGKRRAQRETPQASKSKLSNADLLRQYGVE